MKDINIFLEVWWTLVLHVCEFFKLQISDFTLSLISFLNLDRLTVYGVHFNVLLMSSHK